MTTRGRQFSRREEWDTARGGMVPLLIWVAVHAQAANDEETRVQPGERVCHPRAKLFQKVFAIHTHTHTHVCDDSAQVRVQHIRRRYTLCAPVRVVRSVTTRAATFLLLLYTVQHCTQCDMLLLFSHNVIFSLSARRARRRHRVICCRHCAYFA